MLARNIIVPLAHDVDTSVSDQVWLRFRNIYGILFGFYYIPPSVSLYYSHDSYAAVQEKLKSEYIRNGYIIIGDMNARFGNKY